MLASTLALTFYLPMHMCLYATSTTHFGVPTHLRHPSYVSHKELTPQQAQDMERREQPYSMDTLRLRASEGR